MKTNKVTLEQLIKNNNSTIEDYINFYSQIPAKDWCVDVLHDEVTNKKCALGHLNVTSTFNHNNASDRIIDLAPNIVNVNNKTNNSNYYPYEDIKIRSKGIKTRVIKYLKSLIQKTPSNLV